MVTWHPREPDAQAAIGEAVCAVCDSPRGRAGCMRAVLQRPARAAFNRRNGVGACSSLTLTVAISCAGHSAGSVR